MGLPVQHRDDNPLRETGSLGGVYRLGDGAILWSKGQDTATIKRPKNDPICVLRRGNQNRNGVSIAVDSLVFEFLAKLTYRHFFTYCGYRV